MAINKDNIAQMQHMKYELFKSQNTETGLFDVIFEIDGKPLYAHKTMLNLISPTFASMLSERWMKKDEPIKIKDYGYDNFYQFITFLYSGQCEFTDESIHSMVDIAEFYGVQIFKKYCENYLSTMEINVENIFKLLDVAEKYSMNQLKTATHRYICSNFQSCINADSFSKSDKHVIEEVIIVVKDKVKPEDLFQAVFKWSENQAIEKLSINQNMQLNDIIKSEISNFLPHFDFKKIEIRFLLEFIVPRGYIFSSLDELSKILCDRYPTTPNLCYLCSKTLVEVTNIHGQTLHGNLTSDNGLIETIKSLNGISSVQGFGDFCFWEIKKQNLSISSSLKKKDGIEWYLVYANGLYGIRGYLFLKHCSTIVPRDYLIAEMSADTREFQATSGCKIEMA